MLNTILVSHLSKLKGVLHSFSLDDVAVSIKISLQEEFLKNLQTALEKYFNKWFSELHILSVCKLQPFAT